MVDYLDLNILETGRIDYAGSNNFILLGESSKKQITETRKNLDKLDTLIKELYGHLLTENGGPWDFEAFDHVIKTLQNRLETLYNLERTAQKIDKTKNKLEIIEQHFPCMPQLKNWPVKH